MQHLPKLSLNSCRFLVNFYRMLFKVRELASIFSRTVLPAGPNVCLENVLDTKHMAYSTDEKIYVFYFFFFCSPIHGWNIMVLYGLPIFQNSDEFTGSRRGDKVYITVLDASDQSHANRSKGKWDKLEFLTLSYILLAEYWLKPVTLRRFLKISTLLPIQISPLLPV